MIARLLTLAFAGLFALAGAASAITIVPGNVYQGTISFGPDNLQAAPCCPVVGGTVSFNNLQQYYITTGPMAVGTTFTARLLDTGGNAFAQVTWGPTNAPHNGGLGLGLGLLNPSAPVPASGLFQITASGGPIDVNSLQVAASYNAQVQHPTLGVLSTQLQTRNDVMNLAVLQPTQPPGPNPSPVPLPAPLLMLMASLGALAAMARRRRPMTA